YSLGCTLHFLLLGRPPYQGPTMMATLLMHREASIPSLCAARGEVPASLDPIFQQMVAKKPEERYTSMAEVVRALEAVALNLQPGPTPAAEPAATQIVAPTTQVAVPPAGPVTRAGQTSNQTVDLTPARTLATGGMTILLVEPSRSQAVIIRGYLQKLGFADIP